MRLYITVFYPDSLCFKCLPSIQCYFHGHYAHFLFLKDSLKRFFKLKIPLLSFLRFNHLNISMKPWWNFVKRVFINIVVHSCKCSTWWMMCKYDLFFCNQYGSPFIICNKIRISRTRYLDNPTSAIESYECENVARCDVSVFYSLFFNVFDFKGNACYVIWHS